jgi:hypothetical protein
VRLAQAAPKAERARHPQVNAILGTEHAARFVLDAVSLDLPELQVCGFTKAARAAACADAPRRRELAVSPTCTAGRAGGGCG